MLCMHDNYYAHYLIGGAPHRRLDIDGAGACRCRGHSKVGCKLSPGIVGLADGWSVAWGREAQKGRASSLREGRGGMGCGRSDLADEGLGGGGGGAEGG
ncbi:hypothetical protein TIFTF001_022636 [Ficus carica]|uniref:Uncharacterized protein n=1 Tax=Ficus carica TaxID=3494 RepID=A0AA88DK12_FICCA|nr:hypothetical protein TIFTF001_022636 [Ficus carica]